MKNGKAAMGPKEYEKIGRLLEEIVATGYSNPSRLMWYSFFRGIAYGLGIFLAGTVVISLVIWGLSLFDQIPIIDRFVQHIINSLQTP